MKTSLEIVNRFKDLGKSIQGANVSGGNELEKVIKPLFLKKYPNFKFIDCSSLSAEECFDLLKDENLILYNVKISTEGGQGYAKDQNQMDWVIVMGDRIEFIDIKSRGTNGNQTPKSYADKLRGYETLTKKKLSSQGIEKSISICWLKNFPDNEIKKFKNHKVIKHLQENGFETYQLCSYFGMSSIEFDEFFAPYLLEIYISKLKENGFNWETIIE